MICTKGVTMVSDRPCKVVAARRFKRVVGDGDRGCFISPSSWAAYQGICPESATYLHSYVILCFRLNKASALSVASGSIDQEALTHFSTSLLSSTARVVRTARQPSIGSFMSPVQRLCDFAPKGNAKTATMFGYRQSLNV